MNTCRGEDAANASTAGTHLFTKGTLRNKGDVDFSVNCLFTGLNVTANMRAGDVFDQVIMDQKANALPLDTGIIGDNVEVFDSCSDKTLDQSCRNTTVDKARQQNGHTVETMLHCFFRGNDL